MYNEKFIHLLEQGKITIKEYNEILDSIEKEIQKELRIKNKINKKLIGVLMVLITLILIPLYMIATPTHYKYVEYTTYKSKSFYENGTTYYFIEPKIKGENKNSSNITFKWSENNMTSIYSDDYNIFNGKIIYN